MSHSSPTSPAARVMLDTLSRVSPIGLLPKDYKHMDELLKRAYIGRRKRSRTDVIKTPRRADKTVDGKTVTSVEYETVRETVEWIDWYIVWDEELSPARRKTPTGRVKLDYSRMHRTTNKHNKFRAILEYIEFRAEEIMYKTGVKGSLVRENVLNVAIQAEDENGMTISHVLLPDGSTIEMGKKIAELWNKSYEGVAEECASAGMKDYVVTKTDAGAKEQDEKPKEVQGSLPIL